MQRRQWEEAGGENCYSEDDEAIRGGNLAEPTSQEVEVLYENLLKVQNGIRSGGSSEQETATLAECDYVSAVVAETSFEKPTSDENSNTDGINSSSQTGRSCDDEVCQSKESTQNQNQTQRRSLTAADSESFSDCSSNTSSSSNTSCVTLQSLDDDPDGDCMTYITDVSTTCGTADNYNECGKSDASYESDDKSKKSIKSNKSNKSDKSDTSNTSDKSDTSDKFGKSDKCKAQSKTMPGQSSGARATNKVMIRHRGPSTASSNGVIVMSGGDGYRDFDSSRGQGNSEDASVMMWLYKH